MFKKKLVLFLITSLAFSTLLFKPASILSQEKLATAIISSIPQGATILIDGEAVGKTPIEGVTITIGKHGIMAVLKDYETWQEEVEITEGENAIDIPPLKKKVGGEVPPPPPPEPPRKPWYKKPLVWVVTGAVIGGVVYVATSNGGKGTSSLPKPPAPPAGK